MALTGGGAGMGVCLMIEGQEGVSWDQWVALALASEEHGFDAMFRQHPYVSFSRPAEYGSLDAWTTLAALGVRTERIRLGTLVSPVTFRHPSVLAKSVVTADHASGGRVELGMGAGWFEGEHRAFGFPFPPTGERWAMLEEQVEIVHRMWDRDEDAVSFQGQHYRLEDCHALPKPVQDPHPPLILGGHGGPRALRLASLWADEYNLTFEGRPDRCREVRDRLSKECERAGRDPGAVRLSLMTFTMVGSDRAELERRAGRLLQRSHEKGDPGAYLDGLPPDRLRGTPEQLLKPLASRAKA